MHNKKHKESNQLPLISGVVTECGSLRIRKEASVNAPILGEIEFATDVVINPNKSTDDFYWVITHSGLKGYCMKKYINIGE